MKNKIRSVFAPLISAFLTSIATAVTIPETIHPRERPVIQGMIEKQIEEGRTLEIAEAPGWLTNAIKRGLSELGVESSDALQAFGIRRSDAKQVGVYFFYSNNGNIVGITGNGPWLDNETLRSLASLEELVSISMDHNGFAGRQPEGDPFDGSGFDALSNSKLKSIKIGLSFNDRGMEQAAKIKTLRHFSVAHSRVTEAGVDFFAGHPELKHFSIAEMVRKEVSMETFRKIARIPHLTHVGFLEHYVSYAGGLEYLKPLAGKIQDINLRMCTILPEDLEKLKADHPQATIHLSTNEQIAKAHVFIARNLVRNSPPSLAEGLQKAIDALPPRN